MEKETKTEIKKRKGGYHRGYLLLRILEVQELALEKKALGIPYTRIYADYVERQHRISFSTFKRWMGVPAKRELKKLEAEKEREVARQMELFKEKDNDTLPTQIGKDREDPAD